MVLSLARATMFNSTTLFSSICSVHRAKPSGGVEQAVRQYHELKAAQPAACNFDEGELNSLGYNLVRVRRFKEAIRIFQLNVEAYPQSSNAYDSLAEGYMDDGDKPQAVANYEKSLELNPKSHNAVQMLQKLNAP